MTPVSSAPADGDGAPCLAYVTAASRAEALSIGRELVAARLAACVNIIDPITSVYWWQGKIEESGEALLLAKTRRGLIDAFIAKVREIHSYTVPCVTFAPIIAGNPDYLAWLSVETTALTSTSDTAG